MTSPRNVSDSVRQRLLNRSRSDRRPFNELLQYFAMERFLYRLSQSTHARRFVLKGALMLRVWGSPEFRPTMDIDLLGRTLNEEADFYDIWLLSRLFDFEGPKLAQAILGTFARRGTALPSEIEVFTEPFIDARQSQWTAFRNRLQQGVK